MRSLLLALILLFYAATASASNVAVPLQAEIAQEVSGVADLQVHCENDPSEWERIKTQHSYPPNTQVDAFTYLGHEHVVYLGPAMCGGLSSLDAPLFGPGLQALLHESLHWRLGRDEHTVECAANSLVRFAVTHYYLADYDPWAVNLLGSRIETAALNWSRMRPAPYAGCAQSPLENQRRPRGTPLVTPVSG